MRILDRYILTSFLKNYLISFLVLMGLYVVLDMIFNFDELVEVQQRAGVSAIESAMTLLRGLADYYFFQSFLIFEHLSGIIPVVAAGFTLIRLARFNELSASLAAGVPLLRTAAPIILAGMLLNMLLVADQELLVPRIASKLTRKHDQLSGQQGAGRSFPIPTIQDTQGGILRAGRFYPAAGHSEAWMEQMDVIRHDASFMPVSHILADRADWDAVHKRWRLTGGKLVTGLAPTDIKTHEQPCEFYQSNITPDEISLCHSGQFIELLGTRHINQLLARPEAYGKTDLERVKHWRFTQPWLNFTLLLLAVASLMTREPGRLKTGVMQCAVLCAACLASIFVAHQLAGTPPVGGRWADQWPAIMAWLPILMFGPAAVWLLDRVKT
jgi:lipopolysaccharide export LptBFGC system permease protein LptF